MTWLDAIFTALAAVLAVAHGGCAVRWRDVWSVAALLPLALPVGVALRILADVAADPTAATLWPLSLLLAGAGSLGALVLTALVRRLVHRTTERSRAARAGAGARPHD
jgi:hypothetical protein